MGKWTHIKTHRIYLVKCLLKREVSFSLESTSFGTFQSVIKMSVTGPHAQLWGDACVSVCVCVCVCVCVLIYIPGFFLGFSKDVFSYSDSPYAQSLHSDLWRNMPHRNCDDLLSRVLLCITTWYVLIGVYVVAQPPNGQYNLTCIMLPT
jgi:hypothetical protein